MGVEKHSVTFPAYFAQSSWYAVFVASADNTAP
jgi:hypothetical protein